MKTEKIIYIVAIIVTCTLLYIGNAKELERATPPINQLRFTNLLQMDSINYYCCRFIETKNEVYLDSIQSVSKRRILTINKLTK